MNMGDRIKELRKAKGYTQEELANILGLKDSAIAKYENGRVENIKRSIIAKMADVLECSPTYLMGFDNDSTSAVQINVLGRVAAGIPINAVEEIIDTEEITEEMAKTGEFFGLRISGHSMEPRICDGDVVIVRQQSDVDDGDIAIVLVNGSDGTCKRIKRYQDSLALLPLNPSYEPMIYSRDEIDSLPVKIIGKVVELRGKF